MMTKKELIEALKDYPDEYHILIWDNCLEEFGPIVRIDNYKDDIYFYSEDEDD